MTTSSVYTNQYTRNQLAQQILRKLAVLSEGQTPSTQNYSDCQDAINNTIAQFRTLGMPLWARVEYTFTPTTSSYNIGESQTLNTVFPVKLIQAYRTENNTRIDMDLVSKEEFNILPSSSTGTPLKVSYQPYINYGTIYLWPTPTSTNTATITLVYQRPLQYFTASTETFDMPEEWYDALIYAVAVKLSPEWTIPLPDRQFLKQEAKEYLENAMGVGQDLGSFYIQPKREQ